MRAICFSGSGCLATYQFGVAKCLMKHGRPLMATVTHVVGCSGGSLVAAVLGKAASKLDDAVSLSVQCKNMTAVESVIDDNTFEQAQSSLKLVVSTSRATIPKEAIQFEDFPTRNDLLQCLRASCHIPRDFHPLDTLSPFRSSYKDGISFQGHMVIDGGFAAPIPKLQNAENILVSPLSGPDIHICPEENGSARWFSKKVAGQRFFANIENVRRVGISLVGGPQLMMEDYFEEGFSDCERYLKQEGCFEA